MNAETQPSACAEDSVTVLTWEDSYAIARQLRQLYPGIEVESASLGDIYRWTIALPDFCDDPALANDAILTAIHLEWFEEAENL